MPTREIKCDGNSDGDDCLRGLLKRGNGGCHIKMCGENSFGRFDLLMKDWNQETAEGTAPDECKYIFSHHYYYYFWGTSDIFKISHNGDKKCTFTNKKYGANIVGNKDELLVYGLVGGIYMQITTYNCTLYPQAPSNNKTGNCSDKWEIKDGSCGKQMYINFHRNQFYFYVDRDVQDQNRFRLQGACDSPDGEFMFTNIGSGLNSQP